MKIDKPNNRQLDFRNAVLSLMLKREPNFR